MAKAWAIKDWNAEYETWGTRRIKKGLDFIKVPAGRQCRAYKMLMAQPDGRAIYGTFVALCQFAASRPCRGLLADKDRALEPDELAVEILGCTSAEMQRAIEVLSMPSIGWLASVEIPTDNRWVWDWEPSQHEPTGDNNQQQTPQTDNKAQQGATDTADLAHITKQNITKHNSTETKDSQSVDSGESTPCVPRAEFSQRVERIYDACTWRKEKPREAKKAIESAGKRVAAKFLGDKERAFDYLMARVLAYAKSPLATTTPKQFLPLPASWFNADKFDESDTIWNTPRENANAKPPTRRADGTRSFEFEETELANNLPIIRFN